MLLTRLPLGIATSFDLHVLGTPPALVLSQDQTLHKKLYGALKMALKFALLFHGRLRKSVTFVHRETREGSRIVRSRDSQKTLPI